MCSIPVSNLTYSSVILNIDFGEGGLDCTHSGGYDGFYGLHKFFVQAMIDDYFEELDEKDRDS
jgi:hypothetical protein